MEKIFEIIAQFLNIDKLEINEATRIGKNELKSSIFLRRMYSELSECGVEVEDIFKINTVGDLIKNINSDQLPKDSISNFKINNKIGIDIEEVENLPITTDYRTNEFYLKNFTQQEISYCLLKNYPRESFAGLYCAKEAIIKIDNSLGNKNLSEIEIFHDENDAPLNDNYWLSISHSKNIATGVAFYKNLNLSQPIIHKEYDLEILELQNYLKEQNLKILKLNKKLIYLTILFISITITLFYAKF